MANFKIIKITKFSLQRTFHEFFFKQNRRQIDDIINYHHWISTCLKPGDILALGEILSQGKNALQLVLLAFERETNKQSKAEQVLKCSRFLWPYFSH